METIPRNVILDLLPAYIAGEVSEESRALIEAFAQNDPQIAKLIRTGAVELEEISQKMTAPDDLEMKTMKRIRGSIRRQMWFVALATASILLIPFAAMFFSEEINWGLMDFIVMGILLFSSGLTYVLISKISDNSAYKAALGIAVIAAFAMVWISLAIGIIGNEGNPANLMYVGVLAIGIIGGLIARFQPHGMALALFAAAIAQTLVTVIALAAGFEQSFSGNLTTFAINGFFSVLFIISALLFQRAAQKQKAV